jgi:alpha,alpha-trehalose-phosphate synthase [UDP-forming]
MTLPTLKQPVWSRESLSEMVADRLKDYRLICVGNREPYSHVFTPSGIRCMEPASGVVSALDPVMQATGGTWVAHGSGSADWEVADAHGRIRVPPDREKYTLRRIALSREEEDRYYYGFSNEALWPLCHIAYQRPTFEQEDWDAYVSVNEKFADAVAEETGSKRPLVFIQDYHFALLSRLIKQRLPSAVVFQFWHIPWPNPEVFRICPWKREILEGLLGNDLLSFHIQFHCNNFLDTVDRELESLVDREKFGVTYRGGTTLVRPQAIGVDFEMLSDEATHASTDEAAIEFRRLHGLDGQKILLGVDRLDYTKGLIERLDAVDRLLKRHPEYVERLRMIEIGVPSRSRIETYRRFEEEVSARVEDINRRHATKTWKPVLYLKGHRERRDLVPLYRMADVCVVTPVHDGMNLVAKEFIAAREDRQGVLLLSSFAGAARELTQAILVNPYAVDAMSEAMHDALRMPPQEQEERMDRMRDIVREQNVYKWVGKLLQQAVQLEPS